MVSQIRIVSGITGRYASALFDLARDQGVLDEVVGDLGTIDEMIDANADLARLVRSPVISRDDQGRAMTAVMEAAGIGALVGRFIGLVAQNRRLFLLRDMVAAFRILLADYRGEATAEVTAAHPLTEQQITRIKSQLAGIVDQEISLSTYVDESLLGGIVVRIGSRMVDSSLRTKLQRIQTAMKEVG